MKKLLLLSLIFVLAGCTQGPVEEKEKQAMTCTSTYETHEFMKNHYEDNSDPEYRIRTDVTSVFYTNGNYIRFVEHTNVYTLDQNTMDLVLKSYDDLDRFATSKIRDSFYIDSPNTMLSKYKIEGDQVTVVVRIISPQEPTGWRSWIEDKTYSLKDLDRSHLGSCTVDTIDSIPEWSDTFEVGGNTHE